MIERKVETRKVTAGKSVEKRRRREKEKFGERNSVEIGGRSLERKRAKGKEAC